MKDVVLILHFIGLAMGLGTSFAIMFLSISAKKMEESEAVKFMTKATVLIRMGHTGLGVLFLSGGYLIGNYASTILSNHLLLTKLVLFVVLGALLGIIGSNAKKAQNADDPKPYLTKIGSLGKAAMLTNIAIVILAVLVFH